MTASKPNSRRTAFSAGESNHYQLLGVPETATFKEITAAYREAMKRSHPDRQQPDRRGDAEEKAKAINRAYMTLSKADLRRAYDAEIRVNAVQDQIMNRYVGGFTPGSPGADPFSRALKREQSRAERVEQRRADRSATASVLIVFTGITVFVIALLLLWTAVSALVAALN